MDDDASAALAAELELLAAMYGDDMSSSAPGCVTVTLRPNSGGEETKRFVAAALSLHADVSSGYPDTPATAKLTRSRGLVDDEEAALLEAVHEKAAECAASSEPSLFSMVEAALEQLTAFNAGGVCPICRDPLFGEESRAVFLTIDCCHSFHADCLGAWWHTSRGAEPKPSSDAAPTRAAAAKAEARAADAALGELRIKAGACAESVSALADKLELLMALVDPPPSATEVRKVKEESAEATAEAKRLDARVAKAEARALALHAAAEAAAAAEADAAAEMPLPCPVCRADVSVASLRAGGVLKAPPGAVPPPATSVAAVELTAAQREAQRQRTALWERQQRRQKGQTEPPHEAPGAELSTPTSSYSCGPALPPGLGAPPGLELGTPETGTRAPVNDAPSSARRRSGGGHRRGGKGGDGKGGDGRGEGGKGGGGKGGKGRQVHAGDTLTVSAGVPAEGRGAKAKGGQPRGHGGGRGRGRGDGGGNPAWPVELS